MNKVTQSILGIAVLYFLVPCLAIAQCDSYGDNACYEKEKNLFVKPAYKTGWSREMEEVSDLGAHTEASMRYHSASKGFDLISMLHPMADLDEQTLAKESEEKIGAVTHQLPLMGQQMMQHSEAIRDMLDVGLDGVMTLFKITAHQTEPAEAAGAQGAEVTAALLQNNMYQAQNLMHLQYISDPNMYRSSMQMYSRCMADRTLINSGNQGITGKEGGGSPEYDEAGDQGSWITALAECLGDNVSEDLVPGPKEFKTKLGYSVKNHPAYLAGKDHGVPGIKETQIRLTDLLFAELYREEALDAKNVENVDKDDNAANNLNGLRSSWLELFGDKILKFEVPEITDSKYKMFQMVRVGRAVRIQPYKINPTSGAREPHSVFHMVDERTEQRFYMILEIMENYCETKKSGTVVGSVVPHGSAPQKLEADEEEFWTNAPDSIIDYEKEALSLPGAPIQIVTLQGLYDNFVHRFGDSKGQIDCSVIGDPTVEDYSSDPNLKVYLEFFALIHGVANRIAMAQLLQAGLFAQDFVNERAAGFGLDPDITDMAHTMILETYNGNGFEGGDLMEQLRVTVNEVHEMISAVFLHRAKHSGESAGRSKTIARGAAGKQR